MYQTTFCIDCGKERPNTRFAHGQPIWGDRCRSCAQKLYFLNQKRVILPPDYGPMENEIRFGDEIGHAGAPWIKYIWLICPSCSKGLWVGLVRYHTRGWCGCFKCTRTKHGPEHPNWKGGGYKDKDGYIMRTLGSDEDFFISMAKKQHSKRSSTSLSVAEHRLIMAKHLGRCLQPWEKVHHKNGIKDDNRIENLELFIYGDHIRAHSKGYRGGYAKGYKDGVNSQIQELRKEIRLLQWQLQNKTKLTF